MRLGPGRAALVHGLGRAGVPNTIWDKPAELSLAERERMQLYAYYTDRILRRGSLAEVAYLASAGHERMDGSGYPRGLSGSAITQPARVLAAAGHGPPKRPSAPGDLTPREVEVFKLIAIGHTTAQVAKALNITPRTTDHHIQYIYAKIGASNRSVATLFAMQHGLI